MANIRMLLRLQGWNTASFVLVMLQSARGFRSPGAPRRGVDAHAPRECADGAASVRHGAVRHARLPRLPFQERARKELRRRLPGDHGGGKAGPFELRHVEREGGGSGVRGKFEEVDRGRGWRVSREDGEEGEWTFGDRVEALIMHFVAVEIHHWPGWVSTDPRTIAQRLGERHRGGSITQVFIYIEDSIVYIE